MLKHAIKLVNRYMSLDGADREAFDSLRRDRMRLEASRDASEPKKRRRRRKKTEAEPTPEAMPEPAPEPKRRGRKPKQKTIDEAIADTEDPLDAALKGVV